MTVSDKRIVELALVGLYEERRRIDEEIAALTSPNGEGLLKVAGPPEALQSLAIETVESNGHEPPVPEAPRGRGGARHLTEAGRLAISRALKARWAAKKKAARRGR